MARDPSPFSTRALFHYTSPALSSFLPQNRQPMAFAIAIRDYADSGHPAPTVFQLALLWQEFRSLAVLHDQLRPLTLLR